MSVILAASLPLTSVILVSFHTGEPLFRAMASVLRQAAPVELIVVDNGNPEPVVAQLRAMAAADTRMTVLSGHGNVGFSRCPMTITRLRRHVSVHSPCLYPWSAAILATLSGRDARAPKGSKRLRWHNPAWSIRIALLKPRGNMKIFFKTTAVR